MESKATPKKKKRTAEFKREAVRLFEGRGDRTAAEIAESLGVAENQLYAWRKELGGVAEQVRKERGGETPEEELRRLRRENGQLRQERDVLKKSIAVFARDRS